MSIVKAVCENSIKLEEIRNSIKTLVNNRLFGEHTEEDLNVYVYLRTQEELLKLQIQ